MGTNYYARILPKNERKEKLINAIERDQFNVVTDLTQELYGDRSTYEEGAVIHLGKRSGGWKFLWNTNVRRRYADKDKWEAKYLYPLTKKGISDFLHREDVMIVSEYFCDEIPIEEQDKDDHPTAEEFLDMALNWCVDGYDSKSYNKAYPDGYHYYPKDSYEFWKSIGIETDAFDFYSDGLRFSTSLEFS